MSKFDIRFCLRLAPCDIRPIRNHQLIGFTPKDEQVNLSQEVRKILMAFVISNMRKLEIYTPDLEDKVWHFGLPPVAYLLVLTGGLWAWASPTTTLNLVGIAMVALLVCGIHNAWDSAIWMISYLARDHDPSQ